MRILRPVEAMLFALLVTMSPLRAEADERVTLTVFWHAGDLADLLLRIAKEYTAETGIEVRGSFPPLTQKYYQRIADEFAKKGSAFDLCVFDSQSMSQFASEGDIVRLNDLLAASVLRIEDFDPSALRRYAEYPEGSGSLYALPINQDAMGLVYREDLFADPKEKVTFQERFGYALAVPETYDQLRDIAKFFTRPERGLFGIALYGSADYDACTSAFNNILWSFGAELWNPDTCRAAGSIDSAAARRALSFYKELFDFAPPGFRDAYVTEVNGAISEGRVALGIQWYYYFAELAARSSGTKRALGFTALPGQKGADGKLRRAVMVGGQGVSINQYSEHKQEAWKFLEWFMARPQQSKWVAGGGRTGLAAILQDPKFRNAAPGNDTFALSMSLTRDYWHLPVYPQLLEIYQGYVHRAVSGELSPDEALERCAREQDAILAGGEGANGSLCAR
jgi:multiple sugar transport system substrate-binding protein